jgi:hypothetical protein
VNVFICNQILVAAGLMRDFPQIPGGFSAALTQYPLIKTHHSFHDFCHQYCDPNTLPPIAIILGVLDRVGLETRSERFGIFVVRLSCSFVYVVFFSTELLVSCYALTQLDLDLVNIRTAASNSHLSVFSSAYLTAFHIGHFAHGHRQHSISN